MAYEEMSKEEAGGVFFRAPAQPQMAPAEPMIAPAANKPTPVKSAKSTAAKIETPELVSDVAASAKQMQQEAPQPQMISPIDTLVNEITSNWKPLAVVGGAAAGAELLRRSIQKRSQGGAKTSPESMVRIEPTMAPEPIQTPATAVESPTLTPQQVVERNRAAGIGQTTVPGGVAPTAAPAPVSAPVAPQPVAQAPVTATEAIATGQSPSKAIQMDVAQQLDSTPTGAVAPETEVKKRAAKTTKTFKSEAAIPPGTVFRGDLGNLDRSLYNVLGPEHRRNAMELLNQGKPFGNVQDVNAAVKDVTSRYWQTLQSQIPETILGREERAAQGLKSEFGNYGALGKAAKVAGVAGTLLSIADLAKAAQQTKEGQYGEAAKTVIPVIDPTGLGTAAVQPENTAQMLTNVAPFLGVISQMIGAKTKAPKGAAIPR